MKQTSQLLLLSLFAIATLAIMWYRSGSFISLWLTPDQEGRWHYAHLDFIKAMDTFEDPSWKAVAAYRAGKYEAAAASFARVPTANGSYNMGNAFMKNGDYGKAIKAYELASNKEPTWVEAKENLELSRYTLEYIEQQREESGTGDESELTADEYKFDNTKKKGDDYEITEESAIEMNSAEKWMRSVDTQTRDFLRIRFSAENSRREQQ